MIEIQPHKDGCILPVHAQPGARRNAIVGEHGSSLKVAVTAPADKGRANEALAEVLCRTLGLKPAHVQLISGATSRAKRFLIRGVRAADLLQRLQIIV